jgi:polysaccharide biosynthesis/export protein
MTNKTRCSSFLKFLCYLLIFSPSICFANDYIDYEGAVTPKNAQTSASASSKNDIGDEFLKNYKIKKGNVLHISVEQDGTMNRDYQVDQQGEIDFPLLGKLYVQDKNIAEISEHIQALLAKDFIRSPIVILDLIEYDQPSIELTGQVLHPGRYFIKDKIPLTSAINLAGGFTNQADRSAIKLIDDPNIKVNNAEQIFNYDLIINGRQKDPLLDGNQKVYVDSLIALSVQGAVLKPGIIFVQPGSSLIKAIENAGGFSKMADLSNIVLKRVGIDNNDVETQYNYEAIVDDKNKTTVVRPNDQIMVGECSKKFELFGKTICIR